MRGARVDNPVDEAIETEAVAFAALRRRMLRGSAWVMMGKVASIVLGVVINATLARLLRPEELGAYFTTYALVVIGSTLAQLGLDRAAVRFVAAALGAGQPGRARAAIRAIFVYGTIGILAIGLLLLLGLGDWLSEHVYRSDLVASIMPIAVGWLIVTAFQSLLVETFRGLQRFDLSTVLDALLVDVVSASIFGAFVLLGADVDLRQIVLLSGGVTLAVVLLSGGILLGRIRGLGGSGEIERREILSFAWPLLITNLAILLLGRGVDLWILGAFRGQTDVAIYGAASRLIVFVATPFLIIQGVTPPIVAELHAQGRTRHMERALRGAATIAGLPSFMILMVFVLFGPTVMGQLYGGFYAQGATVLVILAVGRLVAVWTGACSVALMMTGHQRITMVVTLISGLASIGGGILVAPHFGRVGVAITTSSAQIVQNLLQLFLARRLVGVWTHIQFSPRPILEFVTGRSFAVLGRRAR